MSLGFGPGKPRKPRLQQLGWVTSGLSGNAEAAILTCFCRWRSAELASKPSHLSASYLLIRHNRADLSPSPTASMESCCRALWNPWMTSKTEAPSMMVTRASNTRRQHKNRKQRKFHFVKASVRKIGWSECHSLFLVHIDIGFYKIKRGGKKVHFLIFVFAGRQKSFCTAWYLGDGWVHASEVRVMPEELWSKLFLWWPSHCLSSQGI